MRYDNLELRGHTLVHVLREVEAFVVVRAVCDERARELDGHYLKPRYPSSFAEGYPAELSDEATAERLVEHGEDCIALVEERIS